MAAKKKIKPSLLEALGDAFESLDTLLHLYEEGDLEEDLAAYLKRARIPESERAEAARELVDAATAVIEKVSSSLGCLARAISGVVLHKTWK